MGKVIVKDVILKNHRDEIAVDLGVRSADQIRQMKQDMIADSGALAVGLPQSLIDELGLPFLSEAESTLANGTKVPVKVYEDLTVIIDDRIARTQCLAKPETAPLLLGQLVFEQIDYVIDCRNQKLIPNPNAQPGVMLFDDY